MKLHLRLTSLLAVKAGQTLFDLELPEGSTLIELQKYLQDQLGLSNLPLAFTLNGKNLTDPAASLPDGAQITVLVAMGMP
jgi:hypothetical protein